MLLYATADDHVFLHSYVDAGPAKAIVAELLSAGMTKTALARALGAKAPSLQVARRERCTLLTLRRLERLRELVEREAGGAMTALAIIFVAALALAYLLMFAQAVRLPTPTPPERDEARRSGVAGRDVR